MLGVPFDPDGDDQEALAQKSMANVPLRSLLMLTIVIPFANYAMVSFLDISLKALLPLFYSTLIYLGGLGFSAASIGWWLAMFGSRTAAARHCLVQSVCSVCRCRASYHS